MCVAACYIGKNVSLKKAASENPVTKNTTYLLDFGSYCKLNKKCVKQILFLAFLKVFFLRNNILKAVTR
jgi:hypothetical protein